jgi:hypothetical protein
LIFEYGLWPQYVNKPMRLGGQEFSPVGQDRTSTAVQQLSGSIATRLRSIAFGHVRLMPASYGGVADVQEFWKLSF